MALRSTIVRARAGALGVTSSRVGLVLRVHGAAHKAVGLGAAQPGVRLTQVFHIVSAA